MGEGGGCYVYGEEESEKTSVVVALSEQIDEIKRQQAALRNSSSDLSYLSF